MSDILRTIPSPFLSKVPTIRIGEVEARALAFLRRPQEPTPEPISFVERHLNVLRDTIRNIPKDYIFGILNPGAASTYVSMTLDWLKGNARWGKEEYLNQMWPLPYLQEVYYDYRPSGGSSGTASFYIPDRIMAEVAMYALLDAATKADKIIQIFVPIMVFNPQEKKMEWQLSPSVGGVIAGVEWHDFPYGLTVKFGSMDLLERDAADDGEGQVVTGKTPGDVIRKLAEKMGVAVMFFPTAGKLDPVNKTGTYQVDIGGRPVMDVLTDYIRSLGLAYNWYWGVGSIIPPFLWVYDPLATPWSDTGSIAEWIRANKLKTIRDLGDFLLKEIPAARVFARTFAFDAFGVINAFVPFGMDPNVVKNLGILYAKGGQSARLFEVVASLGAHAVYEDSQSLQLFEEFGKIVAEVMGSKEVSAAFNLIPVQAIEAFRFNIPSSQDVENGAIASPFGITTLTAGEALKRKYIGITQKNGRVVVKDGVKEIEVSPETPLLIEPGSGIGAPRVVGIGAGGLAGQQTGEGAGSGITYYPFELVLRVPSYGTAMGGMPALVMGLRPLDGWWQTYRLEFILNASEQHSIVYLRTNRAILYPGG